MRRATRLASFAVLVLTLLAGVSADPAGAADRRPVQLPLASGKVLEGVVESADGKEVVVRLGPDEVRRIPWTGLAPLGVFRTKAALAKASDGDARLGLAEMAVELGLYAEARVEFEKALALGAVSRKDFQRLVAGAETDAVEAGVQHAMRAADAGDFEGALELARDLKLHFGGAPNAKAIDKLISKLVARVRDLQKSATKAAKEMDRAKVEAERNKEILRRRTRAIARVDTGRKEAELAAGGRAKGNVTKARKHAEKADASYMEARRDLGRLRRILKREEPAYLDVLKLLDQLDSEHFALLHKTAWFFWEETVYSRADEYAARASFIDPVHPELLELRDLLRVSRIRYRFSDVTNARPIIR